MHPCPETLPEPGQTYTVQRPFITGGGHTYRTGQSLTLLERTKEAPYGYASSLGNWKVRCPYRDSIWSGIEEMIADDTLALSFSEEGGSSANVLGKISSILDTYYDEVGIHRSGDVLSQVRELVDSHRIINSIGESIRKGDSRSVPLDKLRTMSLEDITELLRNTN